MNELGELKEELQQYIELASSQVEENKRLRSRIQELEGDLSQRYSGGGNGNNGKGASSSSSSSSSGGGGGGGGGGGYASSDFELAKSEWKKQAIEYGERQCQLAFEEFDAEIKKYYR